MYRKKVLLGVATAGLRDGLEGRSQVVVVMHREADRKQQRKLEVLEVATAGWCDIHKSRTDALHDAGSRRNRSGNARQDYGIGHTASSETNYVQPPPEHLPIRTNHRRQ
jgi:hypothetical protein